MEGDITDEPKKDRGGAKARSIWLDEVAWDKFRLVKDGLGGMEWDLVIEIFCEQMIASGVLSQEVIEEIRKRSKEGTGLIEDPSWRSTFGIGEPWPEVAAAKIETANELKKITAALEELAESVENHALAMLEIDESEKSEIPEEDEK